MATHARLQRATLRPLVHPPSHIPQLEMRKALRKARDAGFSFARYEDRHGYVWHVHPLRDKLEWQDNVLDRTLVGTLVRRLGEGPPLRLTDATDLNSTPEETHVAGLPPVRIFTYSMDTPSRLGAIPVLYLSPPTAAYAPDEPPYFVSAGDISRAEGLARRERRVENSQPFLIDGLGRQWNVVRLEYRPPPDDSDTAYARGNRDTLGGWGYTRIDRPLDSPEFVLVAPQAREGHRRERRLKRRRYREFRRRTPNVATRPHEASESSSTSDGESSWRALGGTLRSMFTPRE